MRICQKKLNKQKKHVEIKQQPKHSNNQNKYHYNPKPNPNPPKKNTNEKTPNDPTQKQKIIHHHTLISQIIPKYKLTNKNNIYYYQSSSIIFLEMSSTRRKADQNLHLIPQTPDYRRTHQPLLSSQKTFAIQQKLKLEKQAIQQTRQRQANLDYYIKYNYNPFIEYRGAQGAYIKQMIRNKKSEVVNIAHKLTDMKNDRPAIKPSIQAKSAYMKDLKDDFQLFSNKILNNIDKQRCLGDDLDEKSPIKDFKLKQKKQNSTNLNQEILPKQPTEKHLAKYDIQSIAVIKQQNFFLKGYKKANIFRIARGDDDQLSSLELLQKYHFCTNGVVQKISKLKVPVYRDISTLSRKAITGQQTGKQNIVDYADSYQLSFKIKQLYFHDIMSVASNRFSADFLNRKLNFEDGGIGGKQMSDTSSEQKDQIGVLYRQNQQCKQQVFVNQNQQQQQIKDYKLLTSNQVQKKNEKKYIYQRQYIQKKLQLRKHLTGNTVKDNKLHIEIDHDIQNAFNKFIDLDKTKMDPDRLVRHNKISKNKTQANKMRILLETIAYKNKEDQLIQIAHKAGKKR